MLNPAKSPVPIKEVFTQILKMPYYKNYAAESGAVHNINKHESAIANLLIENGYTRQDISKLKLKLKLKDFGQPGFLTTMPNGTFVEQPFGSHQSPDFLIKVADKIIPVECKSSDNTYPLYNSGGIKSNYYYIFCSKRTNSTTVYLGSSIIQAEQQSLIDAHIAQQRLLDEQLNKKLKQLDTNGRGVTYYTRPMINQSGGAEKTNYMTHQNKQRDEMAVLTSLEAYEV